MRSRAPLTSLCLATLCLAACSSSGGSAPDGGGADAGPSDSGPADAASFDGAPDGKMTGKWAILQITNSFVQAIGKQTEIAHTFYIYDFTQQGTQLTTTEQLCGLQVDQSDGNEHTRTLPTYAPSVPPSTRTATLMPDGNGNFVFEMPRAMVTRGVTLADKEHDPMPKDASDPRIGDWDQDGNPGMTLLLTGLLTGQLYVVDRSWTAHEGKQLTAGRVEGLLSWGADEVHIGASTPTVLMLAGDQTPDPEPDHHTFQLVKVPESADCSYVMANINTLFRF